MILGERGPVVVASAHVCARVERALLDAAAAARRQGVTVDPEAAAFIAEVQRLAAWWHSLPRPEAADDTGPEAGASSGAMSAADAAAELGLTSRRVRQLAAEGVLGHRVGGRWLFTPEEVAAYQRSRPT